MGTKSAWTLERRQRQREIIAQTKPWQKSTGPRTTEGKARSSQNAKLPEELAGARCKRNNTRALMLDIFGRSRWPKWPSD